LVYTAIVDLFRENINMINENTEALLGTSKVIGLGINAKKTKCICVNPVIRVVRLQKKILL